MLKEYGAMCVAQSVMLPSAVVFRDESEVSPFTHLGAKESALSNLGLKKVTAKGRPFRVPDL
jgi:hypothetical protein